MSRLNYCYPHSNALLHLFSVKIFVLSQTGVLQAACHPMKCDVIYDVKLLPTVCHGYTVADILSQISISDEPKNI